MLQKGERARISVMGQARGTNAWFMLFKVPHAIQWLRNVAQQDVSFSVRQFNDKLLIDAPAHMAGKKGFGAFGWFRKQKRSFSYRGRWPEPL